MVLMAARNAQLSARGGFRRHVGSAGHSLGFHESPAFGIAGNGLLSKPTRKESPVRLGLFLCAKIIERRRENPLLQRGMKGDEFPEIKSCL